ncbi:MAG: NAD-dependent epimerase/dehydratase family protein [Anaerolineae bacterium]
MRVFLTGATGFIGSHLARKLIARGDTAVCLVRDPGKAVELKQMGAELVAGDITNRASLKPAMQGADAVVHLAGMYELGRRYFDRMRAINVDGARNTLETAAELGIPRIIHTSTVGVFGNTRQQVVDESYHIWKSQLPSEYERTKWEAHYEVAVPLQQKGAPLIITQPGGVTGAGDTSPHAVLFDFFLNHMPIMFGARSGVTFAHVDDIADGHILALEKGKPGESYILAGPPITYKQVMELCEKATGIAGPKIWLPDRMAGLNARLLAPIERMGIHIPMLSAESLQTLDHYTFWATADKARRELGWQTRPLEETFKEVLADRLKKRKRGN